ncbi:hypothetical protein FACS189494_03010 [Spirochaetia bacterium]|nr:hypothetical protein FACS189494_03010 [Spirochaetia bacterium]
MKKNGLFAAILGMVLVFGLVLAGCGEEKNPSLTISGTAKVGETLTASGKDMGDFATWYSFSDAACSGGRSYLGGGNTYYISSGQGMYIRAFAKATVKTTEDTEVWSNILGPVAAAGSVETSVTISPKTETAAKNGTKPFTVTINEPVGNSGSIVWTVEGSTPSGTSTINGSGHTINGSTTTQTRNLNVGLSETATTLTVKVTYNGKFDTATVTVLP